MHTILLTRIFQTSSDELQRFNLVQSHLGDFSSGITLWYHPLTTTDDGDVLSLLCSVKVDALKYFQIENTTASHIQTLLCHLDKLLSYGGFTLADMTVSRVDYCYNCRIEDEKVRQTLFDALQKCPTKAIYTVRGVNYATSIYSRSKSKVVNVYDKTAEREAKYRSNGSRMALPQSYEQDIVRMELQVKTEHLKYMARRGFARTVTNWINVDTEARYLEKLYGMFPKGDFFTLEQAESLIVSSKYSKTIKNKLIKFIRIIAKSNMDVAKTKLSYNTYRRYLNLLGDLGINPITIPDDCGLQYIKSPFTFPSPTVSTIPSAST